jgi:hypothetical protein
MMIRNRILKKGVVKADQGSNRAQVETVRNIQVSYKHLIISAY